MKDFDSWHKLKKKIQNSTENLPTFKEREVWWCSLGLNIGTEEDGKNFNFERPVLILKKLNDGQAWVLPMSSKIKSGYFYFQIKHNNKLSNILLAQLRLISTKRLSRLTEILISLKQFNTIKYQLRSLLK